MPKEYPMMIKENGETITLLVRDEATPFHFPLSAAKLICAKKEREAITAALYFSFSSLHCKNKYWITIFCQNNFAWCGPFSGYWMILSHCTEVQSCVSVNLWNLSSSICLMHGEHAQVLYIPFLRGNFD